VAVLRQGKWVDLGQLGDATEVIALTVYNGCLYAGSIPRAEVFRLDRDNRWTSVRRLYDPPGFQPAPVGSGDKSVQDWTRASGFAVFQGKLFASTATCYRELIDPAVSDETRGEVYAYAAGEAVSLDRDMQAGWRRVAAVRRGRQLSLYVDGRLAATQQNEGEPLDISNSVPLQIGFGPQAHFTGRIREVRLYNRALRAEEVRLLSEPRQTTGNDKSDRHALHTDLRGGKRSQAFAVRETAAVRLRDAPPEG
jgi:hypothetical protein